MTDLLDDVLWTEKYRPSTLAELALDPEQKLVIESYLRKGEIPHILIAGPPGTGKTSLARILLNGIDNRRLVLNASAERGIDTVRDKIGSFVTTQGKARWNIVFLDEFDAMTNDAQNSMRNLMESYADHARFILTANKKFRVIGPIQDRCQQFYFPLPPLTERHKVLTRVLQAEKIEADPLVVLGYAETFPSMRQMLYAAQKAYAGKGGKGKLPAVSDGPRIDGTALLQALEAKNWSAVLRVAKTDGFDATDTLREVFWAVPDGHRRVGFLRHVLAKGVHESGFTTDVVILFLGVCAEAMEGL